MIKKLSLYGLCFNLGVAFGAPTQAELEAFLAAQGDKIEVTYETIGGCRFPEELVLKDKEAQKAWEVFSKQHGGHFQYDAPFEGQVETPEVAPKEDKIIESFPAVPQNLGVTLDGNSAETVESTATLPEAPENVTSSADYYPEPKKRTEEEMRACFLKYSEKQRKQNLLGLPDGA